MAAAAASFSSISAAGPVLNHLLACESKEERWSHVDTVVDGLQRHEFPGIVLLTFVFGGDELLPGGVVAGIEQTLDCILYGVILLYCGCAFRPLGIFQGGVDLLDVGDAFDPRFSCGVPRNTMACGSDRQVKLFIAVSSIRPGQKQ